MDILLENLWYGWYGIAVAIGLLAWFIWAIVSGGRVLISLSLLILFGLPLGISIATTKFGTLGYSFWALVKYVKSWHILRKYVVPFSLLGIVWWYIWSNFFVHLNQDILVYITVALLLIVLPFLFIYRNFGEQHFIPSRNQKYLWFFLYFLTTIYGWFFWGWVGLIVVYVLIFLLGMTILEVKATTVIPWFLVTLVAVVVFIQTGLVDFILGWCIFLGMLFGGYWWAHVAIKKGNRWLKYILAWFVIFSIGKLLRPYVF